MKQELSNEQKAYLDKFPGQFFLVPTAKEIIILPNGEKVHKMSISMTLGSKIIDTARLNAGDITNPKKLLAAFGEKNLLPYIDESVFENIFRQYGKLLEFTQCTIIYAATGWINENEYILCDKKVSADVIETVMTRDKSSNFVLASQDQAAKFVTDIIFNIFDNRAYAQIVILYIIISIISAKLPQGVGAFSSLLCLIGSTDSRKTSVANALFNPMGANSHNASFEDTLASVEASLRSCKDSILVLDDLSHDTAQQRRILEQVLRLVGDKTTCAKKMSGGGKIIEEQPTATAVVTGEFVPLLTNSSLARLIILELSQNSVNLEELTKLQEQPALLSSFFTYFIQWFLRKPELISELTIEQQSTRNRLLKEQRFWHPRCASTVAWFSAMTKVVADFIRLPFSPLEIEAAVAEVLKEAHKNYGEQEALSIYLDTLSNMIVSNELIVSKDLMSGDSIKKNDGFIVFSNDAIFEKIKKKAQASGHQLDIAAPKLYKQLFEKGLLVKYGKSSTTSLKYRDGVQRRCMRLSIDSIKKYLKEVEINVDF